MLHLPLATTPLQVNLSARHIWPWEQSGSPYKETRVYHQLSHISNVTSEICQRARDYRCTLGRFGSAAADALPEACIAWRAANHSPHFRFSCGTQSLFTNNYSSLQFEKRLYSFTEDKSLELNQTCIWTPGFLQPTHVHNLVSKTNNYNF